MNKESRVYLWYLPAYLAVFYYLVAHEDFNFLQALVFSIPIGGGVFMGGLMMFLAVTAIIAFVWEILETIWNRLNR